jgi:hypothetical protein
VYRFGRGCSGWLMTDSLAEGSGLVPVLWGHQQGVRLVVACAPLPWGGSARLEDAAIIKAAMLYGDEVSVLTPAAFAPTLPTEFEDADDLVVLRAARAVLTPGAPLDVRRWSRALSRRESAWPSWPLARCRRPARSGRPRTRTVCFFLHRAAELLTPRGSSA